MSRYFQKDYFLEIQFIVNGSKPLTLSWWRSLPYRNQSIDLQSELMDWFLCDRDLCHERINYFRIKCLPQMFDTVSNTPPEAVARRWSVKKLFLNVSQSFLDNICVRVSFLIKLHGSAQDSGAGVFPWVLRNFQEHLFLQNTTNGCFCTSEL